jgi:small nuclear ribonucleoprotein (snRNP)-like protein
VIGEGEEHEMEIEKELEGKKVKLKLHSGKIITGEIISYDNQLLKIKDKFNMIVFIFEKEIQVLEERQ